MLEELKSAKKVVGIKQLTKALKEGRAAKVFIAADAEVRVTRPIEQLCQSMSVPMETAPSMEEPGLLHRGRRGGCGDSARIIAA